MRIWRTRMVGKWLRPLTASFGAILLCATISVPADAFSVFGGQAGDVRDVMSQASRWSAEADPFGGGTGLHDGIQVAVDSTFATDLGSERIAELYDADESVIVELIEDTVTGAFAIWENQALRFDIEFGGPAIESPTLGAEIDLFAAPFPESTFFGFAQYQTHHAEDRLLTNGQRSSGHVIIGADIFINAVRMEEGLQLLSTLGLSLDMIANALRILIAHEVGHTIGLAHPNQSVFYDSDDDPYNPIPIDPIDPFRGLIVSSAPLDPPGALIPIMWGGLSSTDPAYLFGLIERLPDPTLAYDDIGGRDVLYPVAPPPTPTPTTTPTATPTPPICTGDCDFNREVVIDELVRAVNIALGNLPLEECISLDRNDDGAVTVDELVATVDNALQGCR